MHFELSPLIVWIALSLVNTFSKFELNIFSNNRDINPFPNSIILDLSKFKAFADDKIDVSKKLVICFGKGIKHCGKWRKCWSLAFSPFPTMFSKVCLPEP